ncbi:hypothetical protein HGRIS_006790 [Hohenbuehelia grisea]|uniref:DUF1793-domain-containing protein n=1 Tax=Hohenbuehelia grisea TaxID=104357 RepID=A0ABR3JA45_9AGAR
MRHGIIIALLPFLLNLTFAQTSQTFWPASVPLAVKSPYLNAWLSAENTSTPGPLDAWPRFWKGRSKLFGWAGFVRVDGINYQWLGAMGPVQGDMKVMNTIITPTRSVLVAEVGPLQLNVTFLSPIEPNDLALQSFPFAYYYIDFVATDGQPHEVQLYTDTTGEWVGDDASGLEWNTTSSSEAIYHQLTRSNTDKSMQEVNDIAQDGTLYLAMALSPGLTWQSGTDLPLRSRFNTTGALVNQADTRYRTIGKDRLVSFKTQQCPCRKTAMLHYGGHCNWTKWSRIEEGIHEFLQDFPKAQQRAISLDTKILSEAAAIPNTSDLVSLGLRQVMAASEITVPRMPNGSLNSTDISIFTKDIGHTQRINPIEAIYASLPAILYLNPSIAKFMLNPILAFHSHNLDNASFAMPDLDTGSMMIMVLAHAMFSGDGALLIQHYRLLKKWTEYLLDHASDLSGQHTSDSDIEDSVNLAIKAIIGVKAMSKICEACNKSQDADFFSSQADALLAQWRAQAFQGGHLLSNFKDQSSGGIIYNLYADKLLRLNLVDDSVYLGQATFYRDFIAGSSGKAGLSLATGSNTGRLDWTMLAAATVNDSNIRDAMISLIHRATSNNLSTAAGFGNPNMFDVNTGKMSGPGSASVGAMFAFLALELPVQTITTPPLDNPTETISTSNHRDLSKPKGVIAALVIGPLVLLALFVAGLLVWMRRRRRSTISRMLGNTTPEPYSISSSTPVGPESTLSGFTSPVACPQPWSSGRKQDIRSSASNQPPMSSLSLSPGDVGRARREADHEMLRTDVEELRRAMEQMRQAVDLPPEY